MQYSHVHSDLAGDDIKVAYGAHDSPHYSKYDSGSSAACSDKAHANIWESGEIAVRLKQACGGEGSQSGLKIQLKKIEFQLMRVLVLQSED